MCGFSFCGIEICALIKIIGHEVGTIVVSCLNWFAMDICYFL